MSVFGSDYAKYYELFYADKDYAAECEFVRAIIRRNVPNAESILELGCGAAGHAIKLAASGFKITGLDVSAAMIARGRDRIEQLPDNQRERITLIEGDATSFLAKHSYDVAIALFHVMSYQTTTNALKAFFQSARTALNTNGIFAFDFWYGPGVLTERPQVRVRRIEAPNARVIRIAEPRHDPARNLVDVGYTLIVTDNASGHTKEIWEVHSMRYLFLPEIELLASVSGFEIIETGEWLTGNRPDEHCWSAYAVARAI